MSIRDIYIAKALSGGGGGGGGGTTAPMKDVNFIDYDGTILYSYTAEEFAALDSLPANPTHDGLTSQGWNWILADAKAQVTAMGSCDIGQMYVTVSGATEIDIDVTDYFKSLYLSIYLNGTVGIDWGDGNSTPYSYSNISTLRRVGHVYANTGKYTIKISLTSGTYYVGASQDYTLINGDKGNSSWNYPWAYIVRAVRIGNITNINQYAFSQCSFLEYVTIPNGVTSIASRAFYGCTTLKHITLPSGVSTISDNMFDSCSSLVGLSVPKSVTTYGKRTLVNCPSLSSHSMPQFVTSIGEYSFSSCAVFGGLVLPSGISSIPTSCFTGSSKFSFVDIKNGLTSIGNSAFQNLKAIEKITIPASVTSIGSQTFSSCSGLREIHFKPTNPPTISNSNAFYDLPTDCKIYVPTGYLSTYTTASNYPSSNTYTYVEE